MFSGEVFWPVEIAGFYRSLNDDVPAPIIYLHYDYLNEARSRDKDTVGALLVIPRDPAAAATLPQLIDQSSENTPDATWSFPESGVNAQTATRVSGITRLLTLTVVVLFFSVLVIVCNGFFWFLEQRRNDISALASAGLSRLGLITVFSLRNFVLAAAALLISIVVGWAMQGSLTGSYGSVSLGWIVRLLLFGVASGLIVGVMPVLLALLRGRIISPRGES